MVLAFHGVFSDSKTIHPLKSSLAMSSSSFDDVIKWLGKYYRFLTFDEYINGRDGVLITFDDGYANNLSVVLPILEKYSAPAIIFVTCDHIDKEQNHSRMQEGNYPSYDLHETPVYNHYFDGLTHRQLLELYNSPLIEIGNHTYHHKNLANLEYAEIKLEVERAHNFLKEIIGSTTRLFAYPRASYDNTTIRVLNDLGYEYGFLLENGVEKSDNLRIKRLGIYNSNKYYLTYKLSILYNVFSSIR